MIGRHTTGEEADHRRAQAGESPPARDRQRSRTAARSPAGAELAVVVASPAERSACTGERAGMEASRVHVEPAMGRVYGLGRCSRRIDVAVQPVRRRDPALIDVVGRRVGAGARNVPGARQDLTPAQAAQHDLRRIPPAIAPAIGAIVGGRGAGVGEGGDDPAERQIARDSSRLGARLYQAAQPSPPVASPAEPDSARGDAAGILAARTDLPPATPARDQRWRQPVGAGRPIADIAPLAVAPAVAKLSVVTPQVCVSPARTSRKRSPPATLTGRGLQVSVPSPSWP